jgi:hypothetical protein
MESKRLGHFDAITLCIVDPDGGQPLNQQSVFDEVGDGLNADLLGYTADALYQKY